MSRFWERQDYHNANYTPADIPPPESDCPCGGWDCSGLPGGPMDGCPYFEKRAEDSPMTPKPTSPVTSTRAGEEMIQANSSASEKVCDHPSTEKAVDRLELILEQAQDCVRGETAESMSDEAAREDTISKIREGIFEVIPALRAALSAGQVIANPANLHGSEPEIEKAIGILGRENDAFHRALRKYPEAFEALHSFWNDAFASPSEPSLLGRETVREALEKIANADAMFPWARQVARSALASLSPLKE